ncbi:MAG: hypothetical protein MN733_28670, partial [Nitrososphaera sp.]|nr:hypothetical protein [Nitrososphaera sp.]
IRCTRTLSICTSIMLFMGNSGLVLIIVPQSTMNVIVLPDYSNETIMRFSHSGSDTLASAWR